MPNNDPNAPLLTVVDTRARLTDLYRKFGLSPGEVVEISITLERLVELSLNALMGDGSELAAQNGEPVKYAKPQPVILNPSRPPTPLQRPNPNLDIRNDTPEGSKPETINHPAHYNLHPSGVECIVVVEHMSFNLGNAVKYIWRADLKDDVFENLKKAKWYVKRETKRLKKMREKNHD